MRTISKKTLSFTCSKAMEFICTPTDIWEQLKAEFAFTIDACASDTNHLLPRYYTEKEDGLKQAWEGEVVYCHPPFDGKIGKWVEKAYRSKCLTVLLLPASTHTRYFHRFIYKNPKCEVRFLEKPNRGFRFLNENGEDGLQGNSNSIAYIKPLMVVIFFNQSASSRQRIFEFGM